MSTPEKLGKYTVLEELGRGAMGTVYKGLDPVLGRQVALKTINTRMLDSNHRQELLMRFQREAQAAGRLVHPNIVMVFEYGEVGDEPYIVMEFVEGKELKTILQERKLPLDEAIQIVSQVLDGLDYAHEHQVVHRDVKPANILVLPSGLVKIADFGIAHIDRSDITQTGAVLGTPSYMSPEQINGQPITAQSDLFSTGAMLYEMLSGEKPFKGSSTSVMAQVLFQEPEPLSGVSVQQVDDLQRIVSMALAKEPAKRYQTATIFNQALRQLDTSAPAVPLDGTVRRSDSAVPLVNAATDTTGSGSTFSNVASDWDRETLEKVEKMLKPIVGPLARALIKKSLPRAGSDFQLLGDLIAARLKNGEGRQGFLSAFRSLSRTVQTTSKAVAHTLQPTAKPDRTAPPSGWDLELLDLASIKLAKHVGPMARLLVYKYARQTLDLDELSRMLVVHIPQVGEQQRFQAAWQKNMKRFMEQRGD